MSFHDLNLYPGGLVPDPPKAGIISFLFDFHRLSMSFIQILLLLLLLFFCLDWPYGMSFHYSELVLCQSIELYS